MGVIVREKKKGSGEWWIFIKHRGKRASKKVGREETARKVAETIKAHLVLGDFDLNKHLAEASSIPLLKDYAQLWLDDYIKALRRNSTYERYQHILEKSVYPVLGSMPIDQVRRGDIRSLLLDSHKKGLSKSSINLIRDVISGVMGYALDEELISANPVTGLTKKLQLDRKTKEPVEAMSPAEVGLLLDTCSEHFREYYPFFLCAFRTGMRLGELLGLKWEDIDWNGNFIQVSRSFKNSRLSPTKTGRIRRVDMSDQLIEALQAHSRGKTRGLEFLFVKKGNPIAQNSIRNVFKRILRRAGLRNVRFHDIRHTYASLLLSNGESPAYVKEQLGHSSIQITVDIYGHLLPGSNRQAVNRLDDMAPGGTLWAPWKKEEGVTYGDYARNIFMVPKARLELARGNPH